MMCVCVAFWWDNPSFLCWMGSILDFVLAIYLLGPYRFITETCLLLSGHVDGDVLVWKASVAGQVCICVYVCVYVCMYVNV